MTPPTSFQISWLKAIFMLEVVVSLISHGYILGRAHLAAKIGQFGSSFMKDG